MSNYLMFCIQCEMGGKKRKKHRAKKIKRKDKLNIIHLAKNVVVHQFNYSTGSIDRVNRFIYT